VFKNFLASITRNGISLVGTALAASALALIITLFSMELFGFEGGPYIGILTYLILPALFVIGLIIIPIGVVLWRRKMHREHGGEDITLLPVFDLNSQATRRWVGIFLVASVVNVAVIAGATYKGVHYMETVEFCGLTCHTVMQPEFTAHGRSPHSRVSCAECHIGPGADWFVKSKLDGSWQMVAVALDLYPRPIPTPLHELRPARETCEQCHWPTKHIGDKLRVIKHYEDDEENTELTTALLLRVGGPGTGVGDGSGIHWHVSPDVDIRYRSDETREEIWEIEYANADGTEKNYSVRRAPEEGGIWRSMDCVDCHNRPTHIYDSPGPAIDTAIADGRIDRGLPFVKRESLRIIQATYDSHEAARAGIAAELQAFYAENHPELAVARADDIAAAAAALGDIYSVNVFPQMEVWWDTYPDHIGHEQSEGCFRCHKRSMRTADREQVSDDCETCHVLLAEEEEIPDIMSVLNPE
jgi:hypothetical protein